MMTPTSSATNSAPLVGNVPALAGTDFLGASEPASASAGIAIMNRPNNTAIAIIQL
jgi:hypothetical protein